MQQRFGIGTRRSHRALERYKTPERLLGLSDIELQQDAFLEETDRNAIRNPDFSGAQALV